MTQLSTVIDLCHRNLCDGLRIHVHCERWSNAIRVDVTYRRDAAGVQYSGPTPRHDQAHYLRDALAAMGVPCEVFEDAYVAHPVAHMEVSCPSAMLIRSIER